MVKNTLVHLKITGINGIRLLNGKMQMTSCIINCELHDYLEIACLYHYRVKLTLKNQQVIEGNALDVFTSAEKREYLLIQTEQEQQSIELNQLSKMQVLTAHAKFKQVTF